MQNYEKTAKVGVWTYCIWLDVMLLLHYPFSEKEWNQKISDNLCSSLFIPAFLLLFSHSREDVELLGLVFQPVSFQHTYAGLDWCINNKQPQSCPLEDQKSNPSSAVLRQEMTPGIILELPLSCCMIKVPVCLLPECVHCRIYPLWCEFVRIRWSALSVRDQWHTLISGQGPLLLALWTRCWLWSYLSYIPHIWLLFISLSPRNCPCIIHLMV